MKANDQGASVSSCHHHCPLYCQTIKYRKIVDTTGGAPVPTTSTTVSSANPFMPRWFTRCLFFPVDTDHGGAVIRPPRQRSLLFLPPNGQESNHSHTLTAALHTQVFDMFRRGGGRGRGGAENSAAASAEEGDDGRRFSYMPPPLSPSALRIGLGSLGIPLGDSDFVTLIASVDPNNRGQVSYSDFCGALRLHQIRGYRCDKLPGAKTRRSSSVGAPSSRASQTTGRNSGVTAVGATDALEACVTAGRTSGGAARRVAMELVPDDSDENLDGGVFHRNPATDGCANPNFTTTMLSPWNERGRCKSARGVEAYGPTRRPSSAPAYGPRDAEFRTTSQGQTLFVGSGGATQSQQWKEAGVQAEKCFRLGLGVKTRYSQLFLQQDKHFVLYMRVHTVSGIGVAWPRVRLY